MPALQDYYEIQEIKYVRKYFLYGIWNGCFHPHHRRGGGGCRVKGRWWERRLADGLQTLSMRSLVFVQDHWKAKKDFQQINDRVKLKH